MKEKGFTLIELLAVIVILSIIALIATPIILNIISDAKKESEDRSVELYGNAVKNGIATYQLKEGKEVEAGRYTTTDGKTITKGETTLKVEYEGNVQCNIVEIYEDGNIYLKDCTVNGTETTKTYGTIQILKPQYYSWDLSGTVGTTDAPESPSTIPPTGKRFYLGYDVDSNNKVSTAYVCFVRNETEYCLKGADSDAVQANQDVIRDAFSDIVETSSSYCRLSDTDYYCRDDGLFAYAYLNGYVKASVGDYYCEVYKNKTFKCDVISWSMPF